MEDRHLDTESLERMIKALEKYQERIKEHYRVIQNAANVCDQAMGSDAISRKQIETMQEAVGELITTSKTAEAMLEELLLEYQQAKDIYDSIG